MLTIITAALSVAALAPLNPLSPLAVDVTTPDGFHHTLPVDNTSGRVVSVCADNSAGGAPVCAPVVAGKRGARAVFQHDDPVVVNSTNELRLLIASPEMGSDSAT